MSEQTFPLGDFNDLESSVKSITQQPKSQKQQARPQEQKMPQEADASKRDWMHFTFICGIEIVDKVKAIAHKEGFSIRDVVEKYLKDGIARYEQKHGAVINQQRNIDDILQLQPGKQNVPNGLGHSCRTDNAGRNRNLP